MSFIYILKNKFNNKCYVGQTTQNFKQRLYVHTYYAKKGSNILIHKAIRKYGIDNFNIEIIKCDKKDLNELENKYIFELNAMVPFGYNLKTGGHYVEYSEQSRIKMSEAHKGKILSEEHKRKIGLKSKGNKYNLGRKQKTEEKIKRASKLIGLKRSEQTKKLLSKQKTGVKNPMYGKMSPMAKKVILISPDGKEQSFESLSKACNYYNLDIRNMSAVLVGKRHHHKNFKVKLDRGVSTLEN